MANIGNVGVKTYRKPRPKVAPQNVSAALLNATAKTVGNAITGTSPYATPLSSPAWVKQVAALNKPKPQHAVSMAGITAQSILSTHAPKKHQAPPKKHKHGGRGGGAAEAPPEPDLGLGLGPAETGTTSFAKSYGKTNYRTSSFKGGPGKAEVKEKKKKEAEAFGGAGGGGKTKPRPKKKAKRGSK